MEISVNLAARQYLEETFHLSRQHKTRICLDIARLALPAWESYSADERLLKIIESAENGDETGDLSNLSGITFNMYRYSTTAKEAYWASWVVAWTAHIARIYQDNLFSSILGYADKAGIGDGVINSLIWDASRDVKDSWFSQDVKSIGLTIIENKDYCLMPILADALEDNNCDDESLLYYMRKNKYFGLSHAVLYYVRSHSNRTSGIPSLC